MRKNIQLVILTTHLKKNKIESEIQNRISKKNFPDQNGASLCGPAALFYCLQMDRPDIYEQAARELWQYGRTKIGQLEIKPGNGCRHPKGTFYDKYGARISGLDWLTLASLRDSENMIFSYDEVDDKAAGVTMWGKLTEWFEKAGYEKVFSNIGLTHSNKEDIETLNNYIEQGFHVVSLISAGMLQNMEETSGKNHWIVWVDKVEESENGTNVKAFSWGRVKTWVKEDATYEYFIKYTFGGLVFKPLK